MAAISNESQVAEQQVAPLSPKPSAPETELRSPSGSFTWMTRQAKAPGTLLLGCSEPESLPRRSIGSFSGSMTCPRPSLSPKPAKHEDPMHAWPSICNAVNDTSVSPASLLSPVAPRSPSMTGADTIRLSMCARAASLPGAALSPGTLSSAAAASLRRQQIEDDLISPRRHSLSSVPMLSPTLPVAAIPAPLQSMGHSSSSAVSPRTSQLADSADWTAVLSSCGGVGGNASCHDISKQRRGSEVARASSKSQIPYIAGEQHLQSQTHAALQQLSIKQPGRGRDSETQLLMPTPLRAAAGTCKDLQGGPSLE